MLQISLEKCAQHGGGGGEGRGGGETVYECQSTAFFRVVGTVSNTLHSRGNHIHVFSHDDTQLLFFAFHSPRTSLRETDHCVHLLTPLLSVQPQTKTVLTHEPDTVMFQQVLFWSDAYPVKFCAVE